MTALRYQTGGRHQTSPAFLRGRHYRSHCLYLTPGQPRRSYRGETEVINSQAKVRLSVYLTRPLMVEREWGKREVDGTEKVDTSKAISLTTVEASIAIL